MSHPPPRRPDHREPQHRRGQAAEAEDGGGVAGEAEHEAAHGFGRGEPDGAFQHQGQAERGKEVAEGEVLHRGGREPAARLLAS